MTGCNVPPLQTTTLGSTQIHKHKHKHLYSHPHKNGNNATPNNENKINERRCTWLMCIFVCIYVYIVYCMNNEMDLLRTFVSVGAAFTFHIHIHNQERNLVE